ncbi:DUF4920 domain-containing protein [Bradymonadaceae bacterium TMQ3]|nr:DUF4920 domain-containing protein [Bradymonadaceae bacterium TMQ3]TXC75803.1 DUF4920 domain-containing protein [Bradymonadales bacterium TMQ1]
MSSMRFYRRSPPSDKRTAPVRRALASCNNPATLPPHNTIAFTMAPHNFIRTGAPPMKHTVLLLILLLAAPLACDSSSDATAEPTAEATAEEAEVANTDEQAPTEEAAEEVTDGPAEGEKAQELANDLEPGETRHFGAPFTLDGEPMPLDQALEASPEGTIRVSANIEQVCKKKGCWFTLKTDQVEEPVRVRMKDYGFFVSRNSDGAEVIVEGTLKATVISEEMAQHYAEDQAEATGEPVENVEGEQKNYEFTATGLQITQPSA